MVKILGSYDVESPEHGRAFKLDVVEGLGAAQLDYIEKSWRPVMTKQRNVALLRLFTLPVGQRTEDAFRDLLGQVGVPDEHWDWRRKCAFSAVTSRQAYAVLNGEHVEAVMLLRFGLNSRVDASLPLIYVDFVAVAPWNRAVIQNPERFRSMGTLMLGVAVEISRMLGFEGRCGLHSLVPSEGFYRRIGMQDFGIDADHYGLRYFEFDAHSAVAFAS